MPRAFLTALLTALAALAPSAPALARGGSDDGGRGSAPALVAPAPAGDEDVADDPAATDTDPADDDSADDPAVEDDCPAADDTADTRAGDDADPAADDDPADGTDPADEDPADDDGTDCTAQDATPATPAQPAAPAARRAKLLHGKTYDAGTITVAKPGVVVAQLRLSRTTASAARRGGASRRHGASSAATIGVTRKVVRRPGDVHLVIRLTPAGRRKLRRAGDGAKLTLVVKIRPRRGAPQTVTKPVALQP